jgi:Ca2+-binding RTX toxin-like protein
MEDVMRLVSASELTIYEGPFRRTIYGTINDEWLYGTIFDDDIFGLDGNDGVFAGDGNDSVFGGRGNDRLFGQNGDDVLHGEDGHDILDGGAGIDIMIGGIGSDAYYVDDAGDQVVEHFNEGWDGVFSSISYQLPHNVETLTLELGAGAINGTGNDLDNWIWGNGSDNRLDGGKGVDWMIGRAGNDFYVVDDSRDVAYEIANEGYDTVRSSVHYTLPANVEQLWLASGAGTIHGTGNDLDNSIYGNESDNRLDGGKGADWMAGGSGNDKYIVDVPGDQVFEFANSGYDTVYSYAVRYWLPDNVETLSLEGTNPIGGTGNYLDNYIGGNSAANYIDGGAGADIMNGREGNDFYVVDDPGDLVYEPNPSLGYDTVYSFIDYELPRWTDRLWLTGSATHGTGNALDNEIIGNAVGNTLYGLAGNDVLRGESGVDILFGGADADTFRYLSISDSAAGSEDFILDFSAAEGDKIDLSLIDAIAFTPEREAFRFIGAGAFNGVEGELRVQPAIAGIGWLEGDVTGDALADFRIYVMNAGLTASDLIL